MLKWILKMSLAHGSTFFSLLFLQICLAGLISVTPVFFQKIVALALTAAGSDLLDKGWPLLGAILGIYAVATLLSGICGYLACIFSSDLLKQIQLDFFERVCTLPLKYFHRRPAGEFMTRFNHDIGQTQGLVSASLPVLTREFLTIGFSLMVLWWYCSVYLTLVSLISVLATSWLVIKLNGVLRGYALKQRDALGRLNRLFDETVQGIDTIKTFAGEPRVKSHFIDQTGILRRLSVRAGRVSASFSPLIDLMAKGCGLVLLSTAYYLIARKDLNRDQFLLFVFYAGLLQGATSSLIQESTNLQPQLVGAANLFKFLKGERTDSGKTGVIAGPVSIRTENLWFSYPGAAPLFSGVDLEIPEKGITLIQGPSGSGKSSLINLFLGFLTPDEGRIFFGTIDLGELNKTRLRQNVGVVSQDHYIFHDSFRKNLSIANPGAGDDEIAAAVEKSALTSLVARFPSGLDQVMDPRGKGLSKGEKQRISMARVVLKNPGIIILDEPWANLDRESRGKLIRVVNGCRSTATVVVLAHGIPPGLDIDKVYKIAPGHGPRLAGP